MATTTSIVSFRPWVPKTFLFYAWVFGRLETNIADYVLARLPHLDRQFWAPDGPGLELIWD